MINDLPELEDLLKGFKDSDFPLDDLKLAARESGKDEEKAAPIEAQLEKTTLKVPPMTSSSSDIANAIIRTFVTAYLPRLATFRKKTVSLLDGFNPQEP